MVQSMTGYGKAEACLQGGKLTIEIRTLNGKTADVSLKSSLLPKDKDLEVRSRIAQRLVRGTIDVFLTWEANAAESAKTINAELVKSYFNQLLAIRKDLGMIDPNSDLTRNMLLNDAMRMPEIIDSKKADIVNEENWPEVSAAFDRCLDAVCDYRSREGVSLYNDVTSRVAKIQSLYDSVESYAGERVGAVKARILKAAEDLQVKLDKERFEQEMIFYLEKLDINEERVRLRQHCKYFCDTIDGEPYPGKKLGFIIQEMGREINTTGSKANHAEIQKLVVQMKDELEKIREQSMNIL